MKICFSTLGCPNWTFDEVISTAKDLGFDGVEIRGIMDEMFAPNIPEFSDKNLKKTLAKLDGFPVSILTSGACLAVSPTASGTPPYAKGELSEAVAYMNLASKFGVPYVRVMCTNKPERDGGDFNLALENYEELCELGEKLGVTPLMETNGMFCNSALLKKFMNAVKSENKGVLWDVHHPYRFGGEKVTETFGNIGEFVGHVHVKDSVGLKYCMLGHGDIPVAEAVALLKRANYGGYLSLEWVKRWNKNLEDGGVVFAQFASKIREYI